MERKKINLVILSIKLRQLTSTLRVEGIKEKENGFLEAKLQILTF